ncbi:hypothetical protein [Actinoallomurus sp. NPDC050550]|uniref:hypothetical protein n=1 Tax=Actinoallomurus sp. NPDC050550 TaxID=3154937 RepID=UPI0034007EC4
MSDLIQVHPTQRLITPGGVEVDIDAEMVPLVQRLWELGLTTKGCCQDFGDSILNNGHRSTSPDDARQRFADFYSGQAWLKMPTNDAKLLISTLGSHPTFGPRMRRWTHPEAWMNILYVFPGDKSGADLADAAQLHFPREQLPELVEALTWNWSPPAE